MSTRIGFPEGRSLGIGDVITFSESPKAIRWIVFNYELDNYDPKNTSEHLIVIVKRFDKAGNKYLKSFNTKDTKFNFCYSLKSDQLRHFSDLVSAIQGWKANKL